MGDPDDSIEPHSDFDSPPTLQFVYFYFRVIDVVPLADISARLGFAPTPRKRNAHVASLDLSSSVHETAEDVGSILMVEFHDRLANFVETNLSAHREQIRSYTSRDPEIRPKVLAIFAQLDCSWTFSWTVDTWLMSELSYMGCELEVTFFHSGDLAALGTP